jgi:hypothetical protein
LVGEAPSGPRLGDGRVVNRGLKLNADQRDFPLQAAKVAQLEGVIRKARKGREVLISLH